MAAPLETSVPYAGAIRGRPARSVFAWLLLLAGWLGPLAPALAQTLPVGSIVAFQSPSGHWLSANPDGQLYLSPNANPGAWEEWQYAAPSGASNTWTILSYFGTTPLWGTGSGPSNLHGAMGGWDSSMIFNQIWDAKGNQPPAGPMYLINGGLVSLGEMPPGGGLPSIPGDNGGNLVWAGMGIPTNYAQATRWKVVLITSPASGRAAAKAAVVGPMHGHIRAFDGSYVAASSTSVPAAALHGPTEPREAWFAPTYNPYGQMLDVTYGSSVLVEWINPGTQSLQSTSAGAIINNATGTNAESYVVLDPTGAMLPGTNVAQGTPFCLRNTIGQLLSTNPGIPQIQLAPATNTCNPGGTWEHWTVTQ